MRYLTSLTVVLGLVVVAGCPSSELKQLARDQAASSDADLKDYRANRLTPAMVEQKFFDDACSWATINYNVNGVPIPAEYAPIKSASTTSAPK